MAKRKALIVPDQRVLIRRRDGALFRDRRRLAKEKQARQYRELAEDAYAELVLLSTKFDLPDRVILMIVRLRETLNEARLF